MRAGGEGSSGDEVAATSIPSPASHHAHHADPFGNAGFPLGLGVPLGSGPLYNQNVTFCPADPTGFVFTPLQRIQAAGM